MDLKKNITFPIENVEMTKPKPHQDSKHEKKSIQRKFGNKKPIIPTSAHRKSGSIPPKRPQLQNNPRPFPRHILSIRARNNPRRTRTYMFLLSLMFFIDRSERRRRKNFFVLVPLAPFALSRFGRVFCC